MKRSLKPGTFGKGVLYYAEEETVILWCDKPRIRLEVDQNLVITLEVSGVQLYIINNFSYFDPYFSIMTGKSSYSMTLGRKESRLLSSRFPIQLSASGLLDMPRSSFQVTWKASAPAMGTFGPRIVWSFPIMACVLRWRYIDKAPSLLSSMYIKIVFHLLIISSSSTVPSTRSTDEEATQKPQRASEANCPTAPDSQEQITDGPHCSEEIV